MRVFLLLCAIAAATLLGAGQAAGQCNPGSYGYAQSSSDSFSVALSADGQYLFGGGLTHPYSRNAFVVLDVSDPLAPTYVAGLDRVDGLPYVYSVYSIAVVGDYVYATTGCADNSGPFIINVADPLNPIYEGRMTTSTGCNWGIYHDEDTDRVYIANGIPRVYDATDPGNLNLIGSAPAAGAVAVTGEGDMIYSLAYTGQYTFGLYITDFSDPQNPITFNDPTRGVPGTTYPTGGSNQGLSGHNNDVVASGTAVYVASLGGLHVFDASDPANPILVRTLQGATPSTTAFNSATIKDDLLYVTNGGGGVTESVTWFDISDDPLDPVLVDSMSGWYAREAAIGDGIVYTTGNSYYVAWETCVVSNLAPTAAAGSDQSIRAGDAVNLSGSGYDDNTAPGALEYSWSFSSIPGGSTAVLADANTATPSFTADLVGTYVVDLVVTDEGGLASAADSVEVSTLNLAPTSVATADSALAILGQTVGFDGSGSSDPEGDSLTYAWTITMQPAGSTATLTGAGTDSPTLVPDLEGDYEVTLTVSDFLGEGTSASAGFTATTASGYAELQILDACALTEGLAANQVKSKGNQNAFCNLLRNTIKDLQKGKTSHAIASLEKALERTDGCPERGSPDGNGKGMDWIIDCDAQDSVYGFLTAAIAALEL